jgi:hypothetical protein
VSESLLSVEKYIPITLKPSGTCAVKAILSSNRIYYIDSIPMKWQYQKPVPLEGNEKQAALD